MKTLLANLMTLSLMAFVSTNGSVTLGVCQYPDGVYQFSVTGNVDSVGFSGGADYDMDALTASGDGVAFTVWYSGVSLTIYGYPDVEPCNEGEGWKPGANSIILPIESDCAFVDIRDDYGNWHRVESDGEPVLLHYGQALIGSASQSTNADDYRVIETDCY